MKMSLKIFLVKLLVFIAILAVVDQGIGKICDLLQKKAFKTNPYNNNQKTAYAIEKVTSDIVIIGASDASHHYIPRIIEDSLYMSVYNCGRDGCFFVYQNCIINMMLERYSPKIIVWEMMEDCLSTNMDKEREYQSANKLYSYYNDSYCERVIDAKDDYQKYRMFSSMFRYNSLLLSVFKSVFISQHTDNGYVSLENEGCNYPSIMHNDNIHQDINNEKVIMLENTIKNCKDHHVQLVCASSPSYTDGFIFKTMQYQKLKEVIVNNQIPFVEFQDKKEWFQDSTLFKDVDHMNDRGSKKYMEFFISELKKVIIK